MVKLLIHEDRNAEAFYPDSPAGTDDLPPFWNGAHVALRIVKGFKTLALMPSPDRKGLRSVWPPYMYEFDDLVEQQKQGELERNQAIQNKTRVSPSVSEIARAIEVCYWPMKYLSAKHPQLCEAVNAVALAHSLGLDAGWVTKKRGGYADTWRKRHDIGCERIAAGLISDLVKLF